MHTRLLPLVLFALPLPAQSAPETKAATSPPPLLVVDARGPAVWRQQLLPTNLGSMLASAEGEALWQGVLAAIDGHWQRLHGDAETFAAARRRILDYAGQLHLRTWLGDGEPHAVTVVADADGRTDMAAAVQDLQRLLANATGKTWSKAAVAGRELAQLHGDGLGDFVFDVLADGRVLLAAGDEAAAIAAAVAETLAAPVATAPRRTDPLLALRLDLAQLVQQADARSESTAVSTAIGLGSLRTLQVTLQPRGPQLQLELALACDGDRGLFAGLFPEQPGAPDMLGLAPPDALGSKTSRFDAMALWRTSIAWIAADARKTAAEVEADARQILGLDLAKDVLAHLNGEALLFWDAPPKPPAGSEGDEVNDAARFGLAVRLSDGEAFATGFTKLLERAGDLQPHREDGVLLAGQEQQWFIPAVHFAVAGDLAVMAIGSDGEERALAVLARRQHPTPPSELLQQRRAAQPDGCNGAGVLGVLPCVEYELQPLFMLLHEMLGDVPKLEPEAVRPLLDQFAPLLQRHKLDQVAVFTGTVHGRFAFRLLW